MARRRRRSRGDSRAGGRVPAWLTFRRAAAVVLAVAVVIAVIQSGAFTRFYSPRESGTNVVSDSEAVVGLSSTHAGVGTRRLLTEVTNNLSRSATFEVKLTGDSTEWGSLVVDGIDMGDSVGFTDLGSGNSKTVDVSLVCDETLVGKNVTYEVTVSAPDLSATIENRSVPMEQYCLTWYDAVDWDASGSETGVVHEDYGDRDASDIELGYNTSESGLVAYWPMDEDSGSTATDHAGSNDGTIQNDLTLGTDGILNSTAYELAGDNEYVQVPDSSSLEMNSTNAVTVSMWVKKNSSQSGWIALLQHSDESYNLQLANGNEPEFTIYDTSWRSAGTSLSLNNDEWYHLAGTFDGSTIRIYVNGTLRGTGSASFIDDGGGYDIGIGENLQSTGRHFDGQMDEVRVYDRALGASAIDRLANGSSPQNDSAAFNGSLTTDWESGEPLDAGQLNITDTVADVSDGTVNVSVQSDTNGDDTADETSDPITLNGSTGPYAVSGMSTDTDKFRLKVDLSTPSITESPCFSGATLSETYGIGNETRDGCGMTNVTANSDPTAAFTTSSADWYNDSWNHRKKITIDHTKVDANLTDFPVLINQTDADLAGGAQNDGDDILFTNADGTTKLDHEIESYDGNTGDLETWVEVPKVNATTPDTVIYLYYNNSAAANQENVDGTWNASYDMVQHFNESSGTPLDSSGNSNDGTNNGATQGAGGQIDGGYGFGGSDDYVEVPDSINDGGFTVEFWFESPGSSWSGTLFDATNGDNDGSTDQIFQIKAFDSDLDWCFEASGDTNVEIDANPDLSNGNWHHVVATGEFGTSGPHELYLDGTLRGSSTTSVSGKPSLPSPRVGNYTYTYDAGCDADYSKTNFDGNIDEVRIVSRTLSDAWVATEYNNTNDPSSFYTVGAEADSTTTIDFDASDSSDADGTISTYKWDWDNDGIYETNSTSPTTTHSFDAGGHDVTLEVIDDDSASDTTTNTVTVVTDSPTASFTSSSGSDWYDAGWTNRKKITIDHTKVDANLTDFPVLINQTDADLASDAQANGNDILFTKADGTTKINHEIESYDGTTGDLETWVEVPKVNATTPDTVIYLYYNNSAAANQENVSGVWSNGYEAVHHLEEASGSADDSTSNANDGVVDGATQGSAGQVDGAYDFDGSNDVVNVSQDASINLTGDLTVSTWVRHDANNYMGAVGKAMSEGGANEQGYGLVHYSDDTFGFFVAESDSWEITNSDSTYTDTGTWHHLVGVRRSGTNYLYVDGVEQTDTGSQSLGDSGDNLAIGRQYNDYDGRWWSGRIDTVQLSSTARSAAWIETHYNNSADPSSFHSVGAEQTEGKPRRHFDASDSSDPDGTISTYKWDWDNDGTYENLTSDSTLAHEFDTDGTYNVTLQVVDNQDATDSTSKSITVGAVPTAKFSTADSWDKRKTITIDHTQVEADLSNFPVLIDLNDSDLTAAQEDGDDILFTNSNKVKLPHEIESFNGSTGDLTAWVNVTSLSSSSDTTLYLYYNNSAASNQEDVSGVWDSDYQMVQHLDESPDSNESSEEILDSTVNANHGSANGSMAASDQVSGKVGGAISFDGSDDNVTVDGHVTEAGTITMSAWVRTSESISSEKEVVSIGDYVSIRGWSTSWDLFDIEEGDTAGFYYNGSTWPNTDFDRQVNDSQWHHLAFVINESGDVQRTYENGTLTNSTSYTWDIAFDGSLGPDTLIGSHGDGGGRHWQGELDEVRISRSDRSTAWIETTYNNQNDTGSFYSVGSESDISSTVLFNASNSSDSNGKITDYKWDWDDDGNYEKTTTEPKVVKQFVGGSHTVTLQVVDDTGATDSTSNSVFAGNQKPTVAFSVDKWQDRKAITIDHTQVDAKLSDYPVLVNITDSDLASDAQDDGDDIVFTNGSGTLAHEIESFDGSTGHLVAWVKVPELNASSDTTIYLNYNNSAAGNQENVAGVWESDYAIVQHLEETSGTTVYDSTANDNDGTNNGATQGAEGKIGDAYDFENANSDYINVSTAASLNVSYVHYSAWVKAESFVGNMGILAKGDDSNRQYWIWHFNNTIHYEVDETVYKSDYPTLSTGTWYKLDIVYNGSTTRAYLNGTLQASHSQSTGAVLNDNDSFDTGQLPGWEEWDGVIDETRVRNGSSGDVSSAAWIKTTFNNTDDPDSFYSVGAESNSTLVRFNASDAADADGSIIRYEWDFTNDSSVDTTTTGDVTTHDFGSRGTYETNLTVIDDGGAENSTTKFVEIGGGTKAPTAAFTNTSMDRKAIRIDHRKVESDLTDFPVLLNITDSDLKTAAQPDGSDIRFTKGTTHLDHEIESYDNTTGHLVAWVEVPSVSASANTTIHMYYNSSTSTDQANVDGVWDGSYEGVWHLNESTGFATDSAGFDDNGSVTAGVTQGTDALIANGYDLGGHHDGEKIDTDDIDIDSDFTVSAWVYIRNGTNESVLEKWDGADDQAIRMNAENPSSTIDMNYRAANDADQRFDATPADIVPSDRWVHVAMTWESFNVRAYRNGSEVTSGSLEGSLKDTTSSVILGGSNHESRSLDGKLDEVRVLTTQRSEAWLNASYQNQHEPASFYTVGGEQNDTDTITFNASDSSDPDGTITEYKWDFNGDGSYDTTTSDPTIIHHYSVNGTYDVKLQVTDNESATDTTTKSVSVANPSPTASFTSSSWSARKKLTIDHTKVDGDLSDFPVLVDITDADLAADAQTDGDDILFSKSDGETQLAHEIESFNGSTGELTAWVKLPSVSASANTTIYLYYNNSGAANQENVSGVWSNGYRAVWHLPEDPSGTAPQMADSTTNDNHGTTQGTMTSGDQVAANVDGGLDLDGSDDYVEICRGNCDSSLNITDTEFTLEAWGKPPGSGVSDDFGLIDKRDDGNDERYMLGIQDSGGSQDQLNCRATEQDSDGGGDEDDQGRIEPEAVERGAWNYLTCRYDASRSGNTLQAFVNASVVGGTDTTDDGDALDNNIKSAVDDVILGKRYNSRYYPGVYDELRISAVARPDAYLSTTYNNTNNPSSFVTVGSEENGTLVHFNASGSSDDGTIDTYEWDFTDDGTYEESTANETTFHRYSSTGTYDVTLRVSDEDGSTDTATNSVTLDDGVYWSRRVAITLDHTQVDSDLTDFPVLVSVKDTDFAWKAQEDGDDIVFTESDGDTQLAHEIESYDGSTGDLTAWVNVTSLSSTSDTTIYLYYGNSSAPNQENAAGVWDSNYKMVQHLNETSGDAIDSTSYDNNGTIVDVVGQGVEGRIGNAYDFEASNTNGVEVPDDASLDISSEVTISAWIKPESISDWNRIAAKSHTANEDPWTMYGLLFDNGDHLRMEISDCNSAGCQHGADGTTTVSTSTWVHATVTYDGSTMRVYYNATQDASNSVSTSIATNDVNFTIGKSGFDADYYDGLIDEVRVSDTARSAAWIETTYNNTDKPSNFHTLGSEENTSKRSFS